jgi:hypothetical protein
MLACRGICGASGSNLNMHTDVCCMCDVSAECLGGCCHALMVIGRAAGALTLYADPAGSPRLNG